MPININPKIWGESFWNTMYFTVYSYPVSPTQEDKNNMLGFFTYLGKILPCNTCRVNFISHIKKYPLTDKILSSKQELTQWIENISNEVNQFIGKPPVKYDSIIKKLFGKYTIDTKKINIFLLVCLVVLLIFYIKTRQ